MESTVIVVDLIPEDSSSLLVTGGSREAITSMSDPSWSEILEVSMVSY